MAALPSGHRSGSSTTTHSTLPSPTMQALKIGSFRSSGHVFTRSISQFDDEFAPEGRYSELDLGYDSTDDFDLEPALTSDATTAPSSSHPPSPSLLPADERAFIDIASSSPVRDSFFRSYEHRKTLEEKPGIREDAAAALLSLALPRIGPSRHTPLVSASLARRDESPVAIVSQRPRTPKELSGPSFNMEAYAGAGLDTIRRAPNDGPTENFTAELTLRSDRSSECSITTEEHAGFHTSTSFSSPLRAPSSLPPSSPLPEDAEDIQDENINRSQLPLSRLSSPLPRVLSPHSISVDLVTSILPPGGGELDSSLGKLTQRPAPSSATAVTAEPLSTISPLSSPPSSPFIPPAHFPQSSIKRTQNDQLRPEPVKKKRKLTPPDDEVENKFTLVNEAPESASAPGSRRRRRNHSESQRGQPTKKSKKRKPQPADIADDASRMSADHLLSLASDRSDATCPYPTFLSVIVEAFALSRATSLGASALFDAISASYPALISTSASDSTGPRLSPDTLDAVLEWGALRGLFETLRSSGDGVPPTYFYIPTADWEKERVDLYTALGGRSARTVKRTYKQYYWKPVVLPRGGRGRRGVAEEEVKKGWDVDWEE